MRSSAIATGAIGDRGMAIADYQVYNGTRFVCISPATRTTNPTSPRNYFVFFPYEGLTEARLVEPPPPSCIFAFFCKMPNLSCMGTPSASLVAEGTEIIQHLTLYSQQPDGANLAARPA